MKTKTISIELPEDDIEVIEKHVERGIYGLIGDHVKDKAKTARAVRAERRIRKIAEILKVDADDMFEHIYSEAIERLQQAHGITDADLDSETGIKYYL